MNDFIRDKLSLLLLMREQAFELSAMSGACLSSQEKVAKKAFQSRAYECQIVSGQLSNLLNAYLKEMIHSI